MKSSTFVAVQNILTTPKNALIYYTKIGNILRHVLKFWHDKITINALLKWEIENS